MAQQHSDTVAEAIGKALEAATGRGAQAAKIHFSTSDSHSCEFEAGRLKTVQTESDRGGQVSVLSGGRIGQASATRLEDLPEAVDRAIGLCQVGQEAHFAAYPEPAEHPTVRRYSQAAADLTGDAMIAEAQDVVEAIRQYDPDLHLKAGAGRDVTRTTLMTTSGLHYNSARTRWHLFGYAQRTGDEDVLMCVRSRWGADPGGLFSAPRVYEPLLEDLRRSESLAEAPKGAVSVVVAPSVLSMFISAIGMGLDGRRVAKGESPLEGKLGSRIAHESLTLVDDPVTDLANGAREIDDCGVPVRRMTVIDQGVLRSFLYDWDSAHLAGAQPTGHAGCRLNSPTLAGGEHEERELISAVGDGLYIQSLGGFGQGNIVNGDFAANVALGWRIKGGRIAGRIKNTMVSGNLYEILSRPTVSSRDVDEVYRMPSMMLEGVTVSRGG